MDDMCAKGRHSRHGRNSKLTDEQISEVIELHKKGLSHREIANVFNVVKQNISYYLSANGFGNSRFSEEQRLEMLNMYNSGLYLKDIAEKFNCGVSTVSKVINSQKNKERTGV